MPREPGYWMHETSGVLRPAVEAYLTGRAPLSQAHLAVLRAYLRQWIKADTWDRNPHIGDKERQWLARMRERVDYLVSRRAIDAWIADATNGGLDPL